MRRFASDTFIATQLIASSLLHVALWGYIVVSLGIFSNTVFLHYTVGVGVDYVGVKGDFFSLPMIALLIFLSNTVLAYTLFKKAPATAYTLTALSTLWHIIIIIAAILIVAINT